jgi:hypothetical protein
MSPEEQERIEEQIAEARETIQREREEYEARQEQERQREQNTAVDEGTNHGTAASPDGKSHGADTVQPHAGGNELTTGGRPDTQDQEMTDKHAEEAADGAVELNATDETAMDTRSPAPEANNDERSKDNDEEVVEAAEDTVIY